MVTEDLYHTRHAKQVAAMLEGCPARLLGSAWQRLSWALAMTPPAALSAAVTTPAEAAGGAGAAGGASPVYRWLSSDLIEESVAQPLPLLIGATLQKRRILQSQRPRSSTSLESQAR